MKFVPLGMTVSACCLALTSVTAARPAATAGGELPPGPGRDTLIRVCTDCHEADLIEGQRRSRAQWREVVEDMVSRGANASGDDTKVIVDYLAQVLGRVNVNKGSASEIQTVLELSSAEASAIVSYRTTAGEFKNLDDLKKVPEVEPSKVEAKKDRITFAGQ